DWLMPNTFQDQSVVLAHQESVPVLVKESESVLVLAQVQVPELVPAQDPGQVQELEVQHYCTFIIV
ncbi:MAG: hypothetical protein IIY30_06135, partial [Erysipelotrichaceae bacterium]|nr:hypothetical protein [Erysipelotrichaceae bacterium]